VPGKRKESMIVALGKKGNSCAQRKRKCLQGMGAKKRIDTITTGKEGW